MFSRKYTCFYIGMYLCLLMNVSVLTASNHDQQTSPFNDKTLVLNGPSKAFQFLVGGHLYGDGGHQASLYPSPSLLGNIDKINQSQADFFVSLGDNVRRSDKIQWSNFQRSFTQQLGMPFFTVPGNHDTFVNPEMYVQQYGPCYFSFRYQNNLFIFIDTIVNDGRIVGEQLEWLNQQFASAQEVETKNVFLLGHMVIWQDVIGGEDFKLQELYENIFNFGDELLPTLKKLRAAGLGVYVFSDDIGGGDKNERFLFHHESQEGIQYLATGIGNNKHDALIQVKVSENGAVSFEPFSLTGELLESMESYDIDYWRAKNRYRTTKNKIEKRLYNTNFRIGALLGAGLVIGLVLLIALLLMIKRKRYGKR